jgi:hypothetical protein
MNSTTPISSARRQARQPRCGSAGPGAPREPLLVCFSSRDGPDSPRHLGSGELLTELLRARPADAQSSRRALPAIAMRLPPMAEGESCQGCHDTPPPSGHPASGRNCYKAATRPSSGDPIIGVSAPSKGAAVRSRVAAFLAHLVFSSVSQTQLDSPSTKRSRGAVDISGPGDQPRPSLGPFHTRDKMGKVASAFHRRRAGNFPRRLATFEARQQRSAPTAATSSSSEAWV